MLLFYMMHAVEVSDGDGFGKFDDSRIVDFV